MAQKKRILLLDRSEGRQSDLSILLKIAGYDVEFFTDELLAVNRYQLLDGSERSFALAIVVTGQQADEQNIAWWAEAFACLLVLAKDRSRMQIYHAGQEQAQRSRSVTLAETIAIELAN